MFHVMMVCTGNICRSPMAAGLLAHYMPADIKERVEVSSAGTHALEGYKAHEHAIETMAQLGIDIDHHRARQLTRPLARSADLILTMEFNHLREIQKIQGRKQAEPRLLLDFDHQSAEVEVDDPYRNPLSAYQECVHVLRPCIKGIILWMGSNM